MDSKKREREREKTKKKEKDLRDNTIRWITFIVSYSFQSFIADLSILFFFFFNRVHYISNMYLSCYLLRLAY